MLTQTNFDQIYKRLGINLDQLNYFCQENLIKELSVFGSILREDFNENSDIDLIISYLPSAFIGLLDMVELQEKMAILFGRNVDLISKNGIEKSKNSLKKDIILGSAVVIYHA